MKKILITGANSYIGTSFEKYMSQWKDEYIVDTVDMIDGSWREKSFAGYDVVFHVAGIAHRKETKENAHLYYEVNRDIAFETAQKAKESGVKQFIFLSSMSVYGLLTGEITKETKPDPKSNYGKSKLQAEELIKELEDNSFRVTIVRPPMVYGPGCKGNYVRLEKLAKITPLFPDIENKRSMIYIDVLSEKIKEIADTGFRGLALPQNDEYVCTRDMFRQIAEENNKKIYFTKIFNPFIRLLVGKVSIVSKVFGDLIYTYQ